MSAPNEQGRRGQIRSRPSGFGRSSAPIFATLHGCLAMFFFTTAFAKWAEPFELLVLLMIWPTYTTPDIVRTVGCIEFILASAVAAPPIFAWRARTAALYATWVLLGYTAFMAAYYVAHRDPGLAITNLVLVMMSAALLAGYRRPKPLSGPV